MRIKLHKKANKTSKFFGFTDGNKNITPCIKGKDYIKYGYPFESRTKEEIQENDNVKDTLNQIKNYESNL